MSAAAESRPVPVDRPQDLVERALALASGHPRSAGAAVLVREESSTDLRWAANALTTNGVHAGQSVTVIVAESQPGGVGVGVVSRRGVPSGDLPDLVSQARAAAGAAGVAEDAAAFLTGAPTADWDVAGGRTGPTVLSGLAAGLGGAFALARGEDRELFGFAQHAVHTTWLGTSGGIRHRHVQPQGTVALTGKAQQRTASTWVGQATTDFADVDVAGLDAQVRTRLGWQRRRVDLDAGRYHTVLPPAAVADLLTYTYWSSDARSAHEGRSVFSHPGGGTRVGERLTGVPLTLSSDPDAVGLACAPLVLATAGTPFASVFDNGLPAPPVTWWDAGRLSALPTTRYTSALTSLPVHPMVDNLRLEAAEGSGGVDDLVAGTRRGLLLTCLWYMREVDPRTLLVTGLTRDGVYLVEDGAVVGAATNFRFNESPVEMLRRVEAVGTSDRTLAREFGDHFPRTAMPALRVADFNMSSVSQAR